MSLFGVDDIEDLEYSSTKQHPHVGRDSGPVAEADPSRDFRLCLLRHEEFPAAQRLHGGPACRNVLPVFDRLTVLVRREDETLNGDAVAEIASLHGTDTRMARLARCHATACARARARSGGRILTQAARRSKLQERWNKGTNQEANFTVTWSLGAIDHHTLSCQSNASTANSTALDTEPTVTASRFSYQ